MLVYRTSLKCKSFNVVIDSFFEIKLNTTYQYAIEQLCSKFRKLPGITFPVKFHLVEQHFSEFLERHGDGSQGHVIADRKAHTFFLLLSANKNLQLTPCWLMRMLAFWNTQFISIPY